MLVQSSLQVVCHAGVQDSISFVGQKVDIILFHALTAFLGVEFAEAFLLSERVLRDCHVASLLAMTNRRCVPFLRWLVPNGSAFPRLPRRFAPRNDKSEVRTVFTMARSERQCLPEIATSASGLLAMTSRGASTVLTAASTDRGCLPEIATSAYGLLAMTSRGASTVLTAASTDRGCLPEIATSLRSSQ